MIEPMNRKGGHTPSRQELADKINELIAEHTELVDIVDTCNNAIFKILEILGEAGIIEEAITAQRTVDEKELN